MSDSEPTHQCGIFGAEVIRDATQAAALADRPRPRGGQFSAPEPIARRAGDLLIGFGKR